MTESEVELLGSRGWFTREDFPGAAAAAVIARQRAFSPAGISGSHTRDERVRNDELLWVAAEDPELGGVSAAFEALRLELNQGSWLGLTRFELQLAHYPGNGARYVRHQDAFAGSDDPRRLTAIVYLNPLWQPAHGGQLRLHCEPPVDLEPRLGRAVIFLAEKVEHEVLPSFASRFALTGWFYGC